MDSDSKYVEFTLDWRLKWADFDRIGQESLPDLRKYFTTSFKNVAFRWFALLKPENSSKIRFYICYKDGPLAKMEHVKYEIGVVNSDQSLSTPIRRTTMGDYHRVPGMNARGWSDYYEVKDSAVVRSKYGLTNECDRFAYRITIKIPMEMFDYCIPTPTPAPCSPWAMKLYDESINNDGEMEHSGFSGTKVAGRDGIEFNCHKLIAAAQSKALETIFQYPPPCDEEEEESEEPADEDDQQITPPNPKKRKASAMMMDGDSTTTTTATGAGVYKFPNMCAASLKSVLEYLYTGKATTSILTVTQLIETADAGEQYDLKTLKELCAAELWKRVIIMVEASSAFEIARFADLHRELKYLKHRALDVIVENYDRLVVKPSELVELFGGTRGKELRDELMEYMARRLRPIFK